MKALRVSKADTATSLAIEEIATPAPGRGEVLLKIRASSVQPADILNSKGGFPTTTFPRTLGKDFAGTVVSAPDHPNLEGNDVYGTSGSTFSFTVDGAQAEYAVVPVDGVAIKPANLSFAQAASVGTPFSTAAIALERAETSKADVVMVLGATGSVGSAVMQIAKSMGCTTISVGRHGTDVNSIEDPGLQRAKDLTDGRGPDVVVDTVGDFGLTRAAFDVLANRGRMAVITAPRQGSTEMGVDMKALYRRQVKIVGCNSAAMSQASSAEKLGAMRDGFESGELVAPEEKSMALLPIERAVEVYEGKVKKGVVVFDD